jgi:tellurite resistance protein TerA
VSLEKGQKVSLVKTPLITATCSWSSDTDYDLYALVLFADGHVETVSTFGTEADSRFSMSIAGGAVVHKGDVGRGMHGRAQEVLEIRLTDQIIAVVPVAYSARSNGTGSFHRYGVSLAIDNGNGGNVGIDSKHAERSNTIYTCVPGIIRHTNGGVEVEALELYSKHNSEKRPVLNSDGSITMDAGPTNAYK